jgi:hypothetical protein
MFTSALKRQDSQGNFATGIGTSRRPPPSVTTGAMERATPHNLTPMASDSGSGSGSVRASSDGVGAAVRESVRRAGCDAADQADGRPRAELLGQRMRSSERRCVRSE